MASPFSSIHIDARGSPAHAIQPVLLEGTAGARRDDWSGRNATAFDVALRWLTASDRIVSNQAARALMQVRDGRLHVREGHGRWSSYLRAYVPMTSRWCQQEIKRMRELSHYPLLAAAWSDGSLSKSHLRAVLRVVDQDSESDWLRRALSCTVRELEIHAAATRACVAGAGNAKRGSMSEQDGQPARDPGNDASSGAPEDVRLQRRVVMAPPGVAALVARAVEVARKVEGYHVPAGRAVAMMADETIAGLHTSSVAPDEIPSEPAGPRAAEAAFNAPRVRSLLGDQEELMRELGRGWEAIHGHFERVSGSWQELEWGTPAIHMHGAPDDEADAHERVVFWTGLAERLDAVRGRLLRVADDRLHAASLGFASFGQYVRERMGLSLREAADLVRLDRALDALPVAFRMYAAGRLGKRAAWLVSRVATRRTDRAWTRFAMTHTLRLLEVVVETAQVKRDLDPRTWERDGGLPPENSTFAGAIRACSLLEHNGPSEATSRICFYLRPEDGEAYGQALAMLRAVAGSDKPEWYGLAVMAQHLLNCHAEADSESVPGRLRRMMHRQVIERSEYTCQVPECLMRGHLEADHMHLRSLGGLSTMMNLVSLCFMDHRFIKHQARSVRLWGAAPDHVFVQVGSRVYLNDRLIRPQTRESVFDEDPWTPWHRVTGEAASRGR